MNVPVECLVPRIFPEFLSYGSSGDTFGGDRRTTASQGPGPLLSRPLVDKEDLYFVYDMRTPSLKITLTMGCL